MAGKIVLPNDIDVAVLIHGDLRIYRATSVGGEHRRRRERGATVARAAEPDGEVTSVALPDDADVAGVMHCDLRSGVESRATGPGEVHWSGESITRIARAAEKDIRGSKEVRTFFQNKMVVAAVFHATP